MRVSESMETSITEHLTLVERQVGHVWHCYLYASGVTSEQREAHLLDIGCPGLYAKQERRLLLSEARASKRAAARTYCLDKMWRWLVAADQMTGALEPVAAMLRHAISDLPAAEGGP